MKKNILLEILLIILGVVLVVTFFVYKNTSPTLSTSSTTNASSTSTKTSFPHHAYTIQSDSTTITIKDAASLNLPTTIITLHDIPSFDTSDTGEASIPIKDYTFNTTTLLNTASTTLYFSVRNQTTAGNANADEALFSYSIARKKITLLKKEEYSTSFGELVLSPDELYILYSDGSHGGFCANKTGVGIYDLTKNKEIDSLFLPTTTVGVINFDHWITRSQFIYKQDTFISMDQCIKDGEDTYTRVYKTYTIH